MTFEHLCLLFLIVPPVLWMMCHSHRSRGFNRFLINALGAALLVPAFCLPGFVPQESRRAANVLAHALTSLSDEDLRKYVTRPSAPQGFAEGESPEIGSRSPHL